MLALIAGRGGLPARIAASLDTQPYICALEGFAPDGVSVDETFRLETLGTVLQGLSTRGVREVCFCGAIERPVLDPSLVDAATLPLVPRVIQAIAAGDDGALRATMQIFEDKGFVVRAAHEVAPDILAPEGVLTQMWPDDHICEDVVRADAVLAALASLDVGQGCVVGAGQVWGIETSGGTDHMVAGLPDNARKARAVLVKKPKQGQDLRIDLPTVGPDTIDGLVAAGLAGLVIDAGRVILLDPEETIARADTAGLVLWSRSPV